MLTFGVIVFHVLVWAEAQTECERTLGGRCKSLFDACPSGNSESLSFCGPLRTCCYPPPYTGIVKASCGNPLIPSQHRIVGGKVATHGAYPWQASLRYQGDHVCGGTLIDSQWILTAAHCFEDSSLHGWTVGLGIHSLRSSHGHLHHTSKVVVHRGYNGTSMVNDVALIKLSKPVDITGPYVRPACLPSAHEHFDNIVCTATGWGAMIEDGDVVDAMREVDMTVIPNNQCAYYMNKGDIVPSSLCAGYLRGGKDTCQGDSGGPLVCKVHKVWKIAGIVSWGYGCGDENSPGVYTRVSSFLKWIQNQQRTH